MLSLHDNRARLLVLTLAHFTVDFYGGLTVPLPEPTLVQHLGVGLPRVAFLVGGCAILVNLIQPISGCVLPKRGAPFILILAPPAAALITCMGLTTSYWGVGGMLLLAGAGIGLLHPEGALAAHSVAGTGKGLGMGVFMSGGYLGFASGSLVSGVWVETQNQDLTHMWLLGLPMVLVVGLVLASGLHRLDGHVDADDGEGDGPDRSVPFRVVFALAVSVAVTMCLVVRFLTIWLVRQFPDQPSQGWGGATVFASGLSGAFAGLLWGHLSDRFGRGRMIALASAACAPFLYLLLHVKTPSAAPLWGLGIGLTIGGIFPITVVLAREARGAGQRLRIGFAIGGAWGTGELLFIAASKYVGRFPDGLAEPVARVLGLCWISLALAVALGLWIARLERRIEGGASPV